MGKFINKYNKVLVTVFLAIIISIIFIYGFSLKKDQIKKSTYHVTTVENVSPYGKGTVASSSTYTKQIPQDAILSELEMNKLFKRRGTCYHFFSSKTSRIKTGSN